LSILINEILTYTRFVVVDNSAVFHVIFFHPGRTPRPISPIILAEDGVDHVVLFKEY
jgi:hypothetical protein